MSTESCDDDRADSYDADRHRSDVIARKVARLICDEIESVTGGLRLGQVVRGRCWAIAHDVIGVHAASNDQLRLAALEVKAWADDIDKDVPHTRNYTLSAQAINALRVALENINE